MSTVHSRVIYGYSVETPDPYYQDYTKCDIYNFTNNNIIIEYNVQYLRLFNFILIIKHTNIKQITNFKMTCAVCRSIVYVLFKWVAYMCHWLAGFPLNMSHIKNVYNRRCDYRHSIIYIKF